MIWGAPASAWMQFWKLEKSAPVPQILWPRLKRFARPVCGWPASPSVRPRWPGSPVPQRCTAACRLCPRSLLPQKSVSGRRYPPRSLPRAWSAMDFRIGGSPDLRDPGVGRLLRRCSARAIAPHASTSSINTRRAEASPTKVGVRDIISGAQSNYELVALSAATKPERRPVFPLVGSMINWFEHAATLSVLNHGHPMRSFTLQWVEELALHQNGRISPADQTVGRA